MSTYTRIGTEIGELVDQKNAAYGSSFSKAGEFLRLLWPEGLAPDRFTDALLLVRIFDKQMRIATDRDAFGESPYRDIAGYGLLGAELHEPRQANVKPTPSQTKEEQTANAEPCWWCGAEVEARTLICRQPSICSSECFVLLLEALK